MLYKLLFFLLSLYNVSFSKKNIRNQQKEDKLKFLSDHQPLKLDPDVSKSIEQIVTSKGYPLESHYVTTKDGYILKVYRIPGPKNSTTVNSKPCLLAHGLLDSSDSFIIHYENRSHSYYLANNGYDVWIMNSRGNKHSRNHISLNPDKDSAFWEFTYYEMAIYDLPAVIDYIKLKTGKQKITYFGHSQGTMQVFVGMSVLPEYFNNSLNGVIALGPVTYLTNIGSSFLSLVARTRLDYMLYYMGFREFLPSIKAVNELSVILCDKLHIICSGILELIADSNPGDDDQEKFGVFLGHFPSGTSLKDLSHFAQAVRDKTFARYDYGPSKNRELYGQDTPPSYNLTKIQNKVCLFVGKDDKLATVADNRGLKGTLEQIGNLVWYQEIDKMGHLTFFVPTDFSYNENVMKCLEEFEK